MCVIKLQIILGMKNGNSFNDEIFAVLSNLNDVLSENVLRLAFSSLFLLPRRVFGS